MVDFKAYGKTPRLYRHVIITEKIDGTNACVYINSETFGASMEEDPDRTAVVLSDVLDDSGMPSMEYHLYAQSRNRFITPSSDNHGFANWVVANARDLVHVLGPGRWYGEWWGKGIQRGYGATQKYFSLFAGEGFRLEKRLSKLDELTRDLLTMKAYDIGLDVVPVICEGVFSDGLIWEALDSLATDGSRAMLGFDNPEGIVVFHEDSRQVYKVLLENDDISKTEAEKRGTRS